MTDRRLRLAFIVASSLLVPAIVEGCGETDETAKAPTVDAGSLDAHVGNDATSDSPTTSGDSGGSDAGTTDSSTQDVVTIADTGTDVVDAGVCPIGIDDTVAATIKVTSDDFLKLYVNGVLVDDKTTTWGTVDTIPVTLFRHPSRKNVIAVAARNAYNQGGLDRGLLADMTVSFASADAGADASADAGGDAGAPVQIVTDTSWKVEGEPADAGVPAADAGAPDWTGLTFDDSAWSAPFDEGAHGISPWGSVFGTSSAHWLWFYDPAAASSKPANETMYARKTIYFTKSATAADAPSACP